MALSGMLHRLSKHRYIRLPRSAFYVNEMPRSQSYVVLLLLASFGIGHVWLRSTHYHDACQSVQADCLACCPSRSECPFSGDESPQPTEHQGDCPICQFLTQSCSVPIEIGVLVAIVVFGRVHAAEEQFPRFDWTRWPAPRAPPRRQTNSLH